MKILIIMQISIFLSILISIRRQESDSDNVENQIKSDVKRWRIMKMLTLPRCLIWDENMRNYAWTDIFSIHSFFHIFTSELITFLELQCILNIYEVLDFIISLCRDILACVSYKKEYSGRKEDFFHAYCRKYFLLFIF